MTLLVEGSVEVDKKHIKFQISPRVLLANKTQTVSVKGVDTSSQFFDDIEYMVKITACDDWKWKDGEALLDIDCITEITCYPVNGVISFEYYFDGEHEWKVEITRTEVEKHIPAHIMKYWPKKAENFREQIEFELYSVKEDLFSLRPFKGDLHIHTNGSDGDLSPAMTVAQYRKFGYDFLSITDHYFIEPSYEAIEAFKEIDTAIKIFPGEEVHPLRGSVLHFINFNPEYSVNAIAQKDIEGVKAEVLKIAETVDHEDPDIRYDLAWYIWISENIRKAGGLAIYPHPYWKPRGRFNVRSCVSKEILERGLCDAFEIMGGTDKKYNRLQVQLGYDVAASGHKLPFVGSSDTHCPLGHNYSQCDQAWTVVFAETADAIPQMIKNGYCVVVDNYVENDRNVYGDLRLARYTWFLIENYFEPHDELCNCAGQAIMRYVFGDKEQAPLISALEKEVKKFTDLFFAN